MEGDEMFFIRKILQALYYIQSKAPANNPSRYDILYLLKLMFFADRYHLRHFGFVASGDEYKAMKLGPVASGTKDILYGELPAKANSSELPLLLAITEVGDTNAEIVPQQDDELSKSFKMALDFSVKTYGEFAAIEVSHISHDYPEWKKHENAIKSGIKSVPMDFVDFFDDPQNLTYSAQKGIKEDPFKDDIDFLNALKEDFSDKNKRK
jgi:uncharacterized phage-associated protein